MVLTTLAPTTIAQRAGRTAAPSATLFDNGSLATGATSRSGVAAPAGTQWSELQSDVGNTTESNTTLGVGCQMIGTTTLNRCADNFVVPLGQTWTVDGIVLFTYQTNFAGTTSPVVGVNFQIWNGVPGAVGSTVVFGNTTTNRLASSTNASLFRTGNTTVPIAGTPGTTRIIWQVNGTVSPAQLLTSGTYWLDFQIDAGASGTFTPSNTVVGARTQAGWDARQFVSTTGLWATLFDTGNPATAPDVAQDFPFKITGNVTTAAGVSVSGRVLSSAGGRGLTGAVVRLTDQNGVTRSVTTGRLGSFAFADVEPGQTYVVSVVSRRFNFAPRVIQVADNVTDLEFAPE
ncbi:MAG: carboxypeptidase-like regulatory domain-containing protein [Pyrinomonadaceae bacterium]